MFRRFCLVLAILAMLTAVVIPPHSADAAPDMQTITLNTGFNHAAIPQVAYLVSETDLYWSVMQDPVTGSGPEPRPADVVKPHLAWAGAQGVSMWISYSLNGSLGIVQGDYYYQKCFCMTKALWAKGNQEAVSKSNFDVSVRADDAFYLGINTKPDKNIPSTYLLSSSVPNGGGFTGKAAKLTLTGSELLKVLRPGRNCLTVRVDDIGGAITGFNLEGSLSTTGIDGIAKAANPKAPALFDRCSSCQNMKSDWPK